ncbi:MAG: lytic transglycosylase domain-containing protein [Betaproteobacteria bacterium]|nr:lytic transglycosylase domain-containing protein [Betaproteobacteria bacterium]
MIALDNLIRIFSLARGMFALVGLAVVLAVALPEARGALLKQAALLSSTVHEENAASADAAPGPIPAAAQRESAQEREQRAVAEFIARRYRVAETASTAFVSTAYRVGHEFAVDPLLILAVMAIESRYNPVAESSMGAKGLMQIIPRFHQEKLLEHGGEHALLDPEVNIQVGTEILREYMRRFGQTEAALQKYAGAFDEPTAQYSGKVLAEKDRLQEFLARARREA